MFQVVTIALIGGSTSGRVDTSAIMGESALIDKETGRVYWEGGSSSSVSASIIPKLQSAGVVHAKATILTFLLFFALMGLLSSSLRRRMDEYSTTFTDDSPRQDSVYMNIARFLLRWTILKVPQLNLWFVALVVILYILEAYNCSTRRYLTNALSTGRVEEYIESLRSEPPVVSWKVRCFHYDRPNWLPTLKEKSKRDSSLRTSALPPLARKIVTHQAKETFQYSSFVDKTVAGVWKRASALQDGPAPFMKIIISKVLVLSNKDTRRLYFKQQSNFVTLEGQKDEYAEFSTDIQVAGFKSRMLAIRPIEGVPSAKLFRLHLFWFFTFLGLTVPYRIWFSRHSDQVRVTVVKEAVTDKSFSSSSSSSWLDWFYSTTNASTSKSIPSSSYYNNEIFRKKMQDMALYAAAKNQTEEQAFVPTKQPDYRNDTATLKTSKVTSVLDLNHNNATAPAQRFNEINTTKVIPISSTLVNTNQIKEKQVETNSTLNEDSNSTAIPATTKAATGTQTNG